MIQEIKDTLLNAIYEAVINNFDTVDAHELGEVVDVLKDLAQYEYYCQEVSAMNKSDDVSADIKSRMYYHNPEAETVEEVAEIICKLAEKMEDNEVVKMKQQLTTMINKL